MGADRVGMGWPDRVPDAETPIDWTQASDWRFEPLDDEAFPAVALARRGGERGGTAPAVYNAANEVCVHAFHDGRLASSTSCRRSPACCGTTTYPRRSSSRSTASSPPTPGPAVRCRSSDREEPPMTAVFYTLGV